MSSVGDTCKSGPVPGPLHETVTDPAPDAGDGSPRTLVIVRHATAEAVAAEDQQRALTSQGRADADRVGHWLREQGIAPQQALVSSAVRTRQTWAALATAAGFDLDPWVDESLYSAGVSSALECVRALEDDTTCAVIVGHNPTMADLVQLLSAGDGTPDAVRLVTTGFPTSAVAVLTFHGSWTDLDVGTARLEAAYVGRG